VAELVDGAAAGQQNLPDQQPQLAVSQHGHGASFRNTNLVQDFAGCRQRLDEHRLLVRHSGRDGVEIALGQSEVFGEGAGMTRNSQHRAPRAMPAETPGAPLTFPAGDVDLADHPPADPLRSVSRDHFPDEFVPGTAAKAVVAPLEFEIGIADAGHAQADERVAGTAAGPSHLANLDATLLQMNGEHSLRISYGLVPREQVARTTFFGERPWQAAG